jgi:hypothetical protein
LYNGVYYLGTSGNALNWRFVGWVYTDSATHFVDSITQRFVMNYYNRLPRALRANPGYSDNNAVTVYTTNSATWVEANAGTGNKVYFLGNGEDHVNYHVTGSVSVGNTGGADMDTGVGEDAVLAVVSNRVQNATVGYHNAISLSHFWGLGTTPPAVGLRYLSLLIAMPNGSTGSWAADYARCGSAADPIGTQLTATVWG